MSFTNQSFLMDSPHKELVRNGKLDLDNLNRQISVLYGVYGGIVGAEKIVLRAGKYEALPFIHSDNPRQRLIGLQRIIFENADITEEAKDEEIPLILADIEDVLANLLARQAVEERLEQRLTERLEEKHQEYMREVKMQIIKEDLGEVETPESERKLEELKKLDEIKLSVSAMELVRPKTLAEVVGQEQAVSAMLAKLATPYPQHMILYGPPGVGKTTAARLVLEEAKKRGYTPFSDTAPFVETAGTTLRWDDRDITNPLIGSVHDPIYQGAKRDLADSGIPEPKPGLVTEAHGGVLFIDEIGEMDPRYLNRLLKVLEDKKVRFESSYYDEGNPLVPAYVRKLFTEGAPADFILIGATTRDPGEINPAIRSRCGEVFFEALEEKQIQTIVKEAAKTLGVTLEDGVAEDISSYTSEGRKAVHLLADAYSYLLAEGHGEVRGPLTKAHVKAVTRAGRLTPHSHEVEKAPVVGKVNALGVLGYMGSIIEIEAVAFPASEKGKGQLRFNDTAGSMAKDSVFNAAAVVRQVTGKLLTDYDIHLNIVGGGNIDGPSAGCAITVAIISAIEGHPVRQDVAITGEMSIQGFVKPVGGIMEKAYGAKKAKAQAIIIPKDNERDMPENYLGLRIYPVQTIKDVLEFLLYTKE